MRLCSFCLLLPFIFATELSAQSTGVADGLGDNFAFTHYYGTGVYQVGGQTVWVIRVPPSISLRKMKGRSVGVRLRTALVFAIQNFSELLELDLENHSFYSVSTGLEFDIPVGQTSTMRPWFDIGYGADREINHKSLILGTGVRTEFIFPLNRWQLGLEPAAQLSLSRSLSGDNIDGNYSELLVRLSARHPLPFRIGAAQPDAGVYTSVSYLFDSLTMLSEDGDLRPVSAVYEIGAILGFQAPRPKIWFVRVPSISVGVGLGEEFKGLRIRFGGDWITPVRNSRQLD